MTPLQSIVAKEIGQMQSIPATCSNSEISPGDTMYHRDHPEVYFSHGKSAIRLLDGALALLGRQRESIRSILDFPCGHGRVTRFLRGTFSHAHIVASDIDEQGVRFCSRAFGVEGHLSSPRLHEIEFDRHFDLIWVGSLLTHVDVTNWHEFMRLWKRSLAPNGLLAFTYASSYVRYLARIGEFAHLDAAGLRRATMAFDECGFGYVPYTAGGDYGQTFASEHWVSGFMAGQPELRTVLHFERGWAGRQNVYLASLDEAAALLARGDV